MQERSLEVYLEAESQHVGQFMLTAEAVSAHYAVTLDPAASFALSDALRRLGPVLAGRGDPAGQMAPLDLMRDVGMRLWHYLLPDTAPAQEREALAQELRNGLSPLLLTLPDVLAILPWELLCEPDVPGEQGFLVRHRPLVRFLSSGSSLAPLAPPLRVLLLISSPISLGEDSRVDVESERTAAEEATREARETGWLHLLVEDIVTPKRVQKALMDFRPHILHYIGHGAYDEKVGGVLLWEDDAGKELPIAASSLADLLRPRGLRAVMLHACQTARRDARTDTLGVAGTLVKAGIPAVLAQQANLSYQSSQLASRTWYQALTAGYTSAEALFEVRQALVQAEHPDWAGPVLYGSPASLAPLLDNAAPAGDFDSRLASQSTALNLPAPTGVFVGRHRELRELRLMLEHSPGRGPVLAFITGPGGVGKSTLAAQAVTRYSSRYKAALTLPCSGYQDFTLSLLKPIAEFLKGQGSPVLLDAVLPDPTLSTTAKLDQAIAALNSAGPFLLVMDNLESVQNDDQTLRDADLLLFLQKLLANLRGSRVLLTGRYAVQGLLPDGKFAAHMLNLGIDDLSPYETDQLIAHHPSLAQLGEEVRKTLIREFGGLPYVYDLLSSAAASQNLDLLLHDIQGRITAEREQRSAQEWSAIRQCVIEFAALEAAVARLSASPRALLARLSVLRRPFPLDALVQGLSASRLDWQALLDWSLLRYDPGESIYRLHSLTRRYAQDHLLAESERVQTQAQLAAWYERYAYYDCHELADYLEAHRLYRASGDVQHAAKLALGLAAGLRRFGLYPPIRELCTMTVQDMRERDESLMAAALHELGVLAYLQGDYAEARQFYQQSLQMKERAGDMAGQAASLHGIGVIAQEQGDYSEARRLYQQSLEISERLSDLAGQASSLAQLGIIAQLQGDYSEARRLLHQSLTVFQQLGDLHGQANSLAQLGMIAFYQEEYEQARNLYQQSLEISERLSTLQGKVVSLHHLGMIPQQQGDYSEARRLLHQSVEIAERLGDVRGLASSLGELGIIAQQQGDYSEARRLYQQSLAAFQQLGDLRGQANSLGQLGTLAYDERDFEQALTYTAQAFFLFEALHAPASIIARSLIARIRDRMGEAAFLTRWRALAGDRPVPAQEQSQGQVFLTRLSALCNEVVAALRSGEAARQGVLAGNLEQMAASDLPVEEARGFLRLLAGWLRGRNASVLMSQAEQLPPTLRDAFARMIALVQREVTQQEDAPSSMTFEDLLNAVLDAMLHRSSKEREQLAMAIAETQQQLRPSQALGRFLVCLTATLRGETPDLTTLEAPFTEVWQRFEQALQTHGREQNQQEPE